jgi:hypothetical protein
MERVGKLEESSGSRKPGTKVSNRRAALRFPIELEVRYKLFNRKTIEVGSGRTINMSSSGALFTTERPLAIGERLELAVDWPARLDDGCALMLVITGHVLRSEGTRGAIAFERYEFRTRGVAGNLSASCSRQSGALRQDHPPQS